MESLLHEEGEGDARSNVPLGNCTTEGFSVSVVAMDRLKEIEYLIPGPLFPFMSWCFIYFWHPGFITKAKPFSRVNCSMTLDLSFERVKIMSLVEPIETVQMLDVCEINFSSSAWRRPATLQSVQYGN